jgi:thiol-disulfide isomerase/thioredoxin
MKRIIAIIFFAFLGFIAAFGQGNTRISGTVLNAKDSTLNLRMTIFDAFNLTESKTSELKTLNGKFDFKFNINKPSTIYLTLNNKFIVMPGVWSMLLEPGDDIHISIPAMKTAGFFGFGIMNVKFSGKGSEKFSLLQTAIGPMQRILKGTLPFDKQSLTYKYQMADLNLNLIDSAFQNYKGKVSPKIKDILKAQLYNGVLDGLFTSSLRSESDSVRFLFDRYIVNKNRMAVFFKDEVIYYEGGWQVVPNYFVLSEFKNPVYVGADRFSVQNRVAMAKMELKYLKNQPIVRDFLLSNQTLTHINRKHDDPTVKELYEFYKNNADPGNPFFNQVVSAYEYLQNNLAFGSSFYNFSLPDPKGKIHRLNDFKGKVLVFDFWFNGCPGCKLITPLMEELEKEYEGQNVQFISVSIDNKKDWLDGIGKYCSKNSLQLYTEDQKKEHPFIKYLNFSGYPRLIVVDKNGNMAGTPPDPRSDKEGFKKFVNKYL